MHGKRIYIILIRFNDTIQQSIFNTENNSQLRSPVHFGAADLGVVDLVQRPKVHC